MILNHLWQSSLFVVAVWLLTLALKKNRAAVRYGLWLSASVKFLIPFSLLVSFGSLFGWRTAPVVMQPQVSFVMEEVSRASVAPVVVAGAAPGFSFVPVLVGIWVVGILVGVILWMRWWLRIRAVVRTAAAYPHAYAWRFGVRGGLEDGRLGGQVGDLPYLISSERMEPGVVGIFRPVLLLPEGIADRLTPPQLEAIIAHEVCHVRRRDNLTAAIHMVVETIFWFHPLVWWIRARLIDERERACDEEVLRLGSDAEIYAESILEACKHYLESPLACVSGVTGSDLKKRIEAIMANRGAARVNLSKKLMLAIAGISAVMGPVAIGVLNAPLRALAQSHLEFDMATVKLVKPGTPENRKITAAHGRLTMQQQNLRECIIWAYGLNAASEIKGPEWLGAEQYDIEAKADESTTEAQLRAMLQALLADRFKLAMRRTTEQRPLYALVVGKGGPKMREVQQEPRRQFYVAHKDNVLNYNLVTNMARLAEILPTFLDQPVLDKTGLKGVYDFTLRVEVDPEFRFPERGQVFHGFGMTPSIFGAVEQLGLKLVSEKGPVEVLVVEHAERPSVNEQAFFRKAMWSPPQTFEVASVKPNRSGSERGTDLFLPGGRYTATNKSVRDLILTAYGINMSPYLLSGGPKWIESERYDVEAKAEAGAIPAGTPTKVMVEKGRAMLQALLAERFHLIVRRERKEMPVYEMVLAKSGPKVEKLPQECDASDLMCHGFSFNSGRGEGTGVDMSDIALLLSHYSDRPVVDKTGFAGTFNIKLQWNPFAGRPQPLGDASRAPGAEAREGRRSDLDSLPTMFEAVEQQLGVKLESRKGSVDTYVIERVERASGN